MSRFPVSLAVLLAVLVLLGGCEAQAPATTTPLASDAPLTPSAPARSTARDPFQVAARIRYLERYTGGARRDQRLPMIVAIHGLGDQPQRFVGVLAGFERPARIIVPQGLDPYHDGFSWFPIRVADQDPEGIARGMRRAAGRLAAMLTELGARHPTQGKPVVTGFSQGGMLSFALAVDHPQAIAAAVPLAGWLPPPMWPAAAPAGAPPIVALHGDADALLRIAPTREAVRHLKQVGFTVELHEYPGVRHTVSPAMRRQLYRQLAQVIGKPSSP